MWEQGTGDKRRLIVQDIYENVAELREIIQAWWTVFISVKLEHVLTPQLRRRGDAEIPLFQANAAGEVEIGKIQNCRTNLNRLFRSERMDEFYQGVMDELQGLENEPHQPRAKDGILYVLYSYDPNDLFVPLYIGKTERAGKSHNLSANLRMPEAFGRWGYVYSRHMGDLSNAYFLLSNQRELIESPRAILDAHQKEAWVRTLFTSPLTNPPTLRFPVYFHAFTWGPAEDSHLMLLDANNQRRPVSLTTAQLERLLIGMGSNFYTQNLNKNWGREDFSKVFAVLEGISSKCDVMDDLSPFLPLLEKKA
jgi:hypothetical protein